MSIVRLRQMPQKAYFSLLCSPKHELGSVRSPHPLNESAFFRFSSKLHSSYQRQARASSTPAASTMRFSHFTQLAALVTLVPAAMADLDIYKVHASDVFVGEDELWQFFNGPPSCDDRCGTAAWNNLGDVSGDKRGDSLRE
ncbi:hypothetical protein MCOR33_009256 [Pyricularia grisea]|uniref:Uncharacterized protein n=1 Tax=Pyricularia grisea TaxID=148305 RepID=A0ABQ8N917_PYRGI|nr:hypothetical protein MCOR33_009256 [Pyricularia grisea]